MLKKFIKANRFALIISSLINQTVKNKEMNRYKYHHKKVRKQ